MPGSCLPSGGRVDGVHGRRQGVRVAKSAPKLSPRAARFVAEYLVDCNATAAAERAGYSKRAASVQGWRLLRNAKVGAAIAAG